jgi:hypothetical protein
MSKQHSAPPHSRPRVCPYARFLATVYAQSISVSSTTFPCSWLGSYMFSIMNVSNHTLLSLINLSSSSPSLSCPPESKLKALNFVYDPGKSRSKAIRAAMLVNTHPFSEYPALTSSACIVSILFGTVPSITSQIGALVALDKDWNASDPGPGSRQQFIPSPSLNIRWGGGGGSPHSALQPTAQITSNNIGLRSLKLSKVSYLGSNTGTYLSFPTSAYTPFV